MIIECLNLELHYNYLMKYLKLFNEKYVGIAQKFAVPIFSIGLLSLVLGVFTMTQFPKVGPIGPAGPQGVQGEKGERGNTGPVGQRGATGISAYEYWIDLGNQGTEAEFLASLVGPQGPQGIKGDTGNLGPQGPRGETGSVSGLRTKSIDYYCEYGFGFGPQVVTDVSYRSWDTFSPISVSTRRISICSERVFAP